MYFYAMIYFLREDDALYTSRGNTRVPYLAAQSRCT